VSNLLDHQPLLRCKKVIRMRARLYLHVGLWCALLGVFVARSLPVVGPVILESKIGPNDPNHSTDSYLSGLTHVHNGSQLFSVLLEAVPRDKSFVIFVDAESSPSEFLGMLVAYLSWPHDVRIIEVRGANLEQETAAAQSSSIGGLFFCFLTPPASLTGGTHFGSAIIFVPSAGPRLNP
jgi:hypothetical protein